MYFIEYKVRKVKGIVMKRLLILLVCIFFTALNANASTTVYYQNTGVPLYIQRGAGPRVSIHSIQSNPHYRPMAYRNNFSHPYGMQRYARNRYAQPRGVNQINNNHIVIGNVPPKPVAPAVNSVPVSRLNKGYKPRSVRSYSRNGMVYYN